MTLAEATTKVRELSRTSSSGLTDTRVMYAINEGMNAFALDVCSSGLKKEDFLTVSPKFTTETNFALRVTITGGTNALAATDVAITATARTGIAGTTIAADLQTALRAAVGVGANLTVTWSTTTWRFTIDTIDGTAISVQAPSGITYVDATDILLGGTSSGTQTLVGGFPEDCTIEVDLPTDFLTMMAVEWDNYPLTQAPHSHFLSPESYGDPLYYNIQTKKLYLSPSPDRQELLHIWYKYRPEAFTDATTQAATELPIETAYQMAIVHWAASYIAECNHEQLVSDRNLIRYESFKNKYIISQANNNPQMFPQPLGSRPTDLDWSTFT